VFRLGSVYVGDREVWQSKTDWERCLTLLAGHHPFLSLEILLLASLALLFLYARYWESVGLTAQV
jgi:hypothetical protein